MTHLEKFLEKVKEAFPQSDPQEAWRLASVDTEEKYCQIVNNLQGNYVCGLELVKGRCPYHLDKGYDFWRSCGFIYTNGEKCRSPLKTRDLSVVWCTYHLNAPKSNVFLSRMGEYIVIKDTPYALSDDMLAIIGRVETNYSLQFVLRRERDEVMAEVAQNYGLVIRLDEEN